MDLNLNAAASFHEYSLNNDNQLNIRAPSGGRMEWNSSILQSSGSNFLPSYRPHPETNIISPRMDTASKIIPKRNFMDRIVVPNVVRVL